MASTSKCNSQIVPQFGKLFHLVQPWSELIWSSSSNRCIVNRRLYPPRIACLLSNMKPITVSNMMNGKYMYALQAGCVSLSRKSGNSPFWEPQGGGFQSVIWPHNPKYKIQLMDWCELGTRPSAGENVIQICLTIIGMFYLWNRHLCPSGSPLNLSETRPRTLRACFVSKWI